MVQPLASLNIRNSSIQASDVVAEQVGAGRVNMRLSAAQAVALQGFGTNPMETFMGTFIITTQGQQHEIAVFILSVTWDAFAAIANVVAEVVPRAASEKAYCAAFVGC